MMINILGKEKKDYRYMLTLKFEKITGWNFLMSNVGMTTLVNV